MKKVKILALTLVSPDLPDIVYERFKKSREALVSFSEYLFDIEWIDDNRIEPRLPNDVVPVSQVARIRNALIDEKLKDHDFVFWMDSDLVDFASDTLRQLYNRWYSFSAIIAPRNLIELTDKWHDVGAFIQRGTSHIRPQQPGQIYGRNLESDPPYWHPGYQLQPLMEMDSVAQCVLIPAIVYTEGKARHNASTVFYEFLSVCRQAKEMGIKTFVDRTLTCFHADRSLYGRNWGTP